jgi:hypothetical protein
VKWQVATIRILVGMAMVALQNFSTGLEQDLNRLAGKPTSSSSSSSSSSGSSGSSGGTEPQPSIEQQQDQQQQQQQQQEALSPDMQLALLFRSQRKQLLVDVISQLAKKLKQVGAKQVRDIRWRCAADAVS